MGDDILSGQVPVYPSCRSHREVAHSAEGDHWCNQCGWYRGGAEGPARKVGRPNGGFA